jgi:hypothetical protein
LDSEYFSIGGYVKAKPNLVVTVSEVHEMKIQVADLSKKFDDLKSFVETDYNRIASYTTISIAIQAGILTLFTILFAILAAIYASNLNKTVDRIYKSNDEAKKKLEEIEKAKSEVEKLKSETIELLRRIDEEPKKKYDTIKDQEIQAIFNGLEKIPENIAHHFSSISTANELNIKYFPILKKLNSFDSQWSNYYLQLAVQFFPKEVFLDSGLHQKTNENIEMIYTSMFLSEKQNHLKIMNSIFDEVDIKHHYLAFISFLYADKGYKNCIDEIKKFPITWIPDVLNEDLRKYLTDITKQ